MQIWFTVATLSLTLAVKKQSGYQQSLLKNVFELKVQVTKQINSDKCVFLDVHTVIMLKVHSTFNYGASLVTVVNVCFVEAGLTVTLVIN